MQNINKPMNVELDITRACNCSCRGCNRLCNFKNTNAQSTMTLDDVKQISDQLKEHSIKGINVLGGEPCMNPDVYDICLYLRNTFKALPIRFATNGTFKSKIEELKSIHGLTFCMKHEQPEKYAEVHHANLFDRRNFVIKDAYYDCKTLDDCGICVYKQNGKILWSNCANSMYISRLLGIEDKYSRPTFNDLIQSVDDKDFFKDICSNCALYCRAWQELMNKHKDFSVVDGIFKEGLQKINAS